MTRCTVCKTDNVANAIYCSQCGASLIGDDTKKTDPLDASERNWRGEPVSPKASQPDRPCANPLAIRLKIGIAEREVELQLDKPLLIGRTDPAANIFPEIDVTDDIAPHKSVSRSHAVITKNDDEVTIKDLGSINGTFLNGERIEALSDEPLTNGDTIQLGKLLIEVEIITG